MSFTTWSASVNTLDFVSDNNQQLNDKASISDWRTCNLHGRLCHHLADLFKFLLYIMVTVAKQKQMNKQNSKCPLENNPHNKKQNKLVQVGKVRIHLAV
jgi:hypothetical protein